MSCRNRPGTQRSEQYADLLGLPPWDIYVGENSYASSVSPTQFRKVFGDHDFGLVGGVKEWSAQSVDYDCHSSVGGTVGHFTQVARAETTRVGCGFYHCLGSLWATIFVCSFHKGQFPDRPYLDGATLGDVCTQGLEDGDTCAHGLITPADYTTGVN